MVREELVSYKLSLSEALDIVLKVFIKDNPEYVFHAWVNDLPSEIFKSKESIKLILQRRVKTTTIIQ